MPTESTTGALEASESNASQGSRNPVFSPFSPESIWNHPIGDGATYAHAHLQAQTHFVADTDHFFVLSPNDPHQNLFQIGGWRDRATGTVDTGLDLPLPNALIIPDTNEVETPNNAAAFLLPDAFILSDNFQLPDDFNLPDDFEIPENGTVTVTVDENGNVTVDENGNVVVDANGNVTIGNVTVDEHGSATPGQYSLVQLNATTREVIEGTVFGVPYPQFPSNFVVHGESLNETGILGGHGGSALSSIGGTIRIGELTGDAPINHALKVNVWASQYLSYDADSETPGYRWPAIKADSYAGESGDRGYGGENPDLVMGSLLAIPTEGQVEQDDGDTVTVSITADYLGLQTEPARKLFYALQNYGAYVVDDTAWDAQAFALESGALQDFEHAYGYSFEVAEYDKYDKNAHPETESFYQDMEALFEALHVVTNNAPDNIGGGGDPLVPLSPELDLGAVTELRDLIEDQTVQDTFEADFDGDGNLDLLWRNLATGANQLWLRDSEGTFIGGGNILPLADWDWQIVGTPDADGDGKAEILWRDRTTGDPQLWHMDDIRQWVNADGDRVARWIESAAGSPTIEYQECFLTGTLIATAEGEVAVEKLSVGDRVQTAEGTLERIKWIGRQTMKPEEVRNPMRGYPIWVKAGALGDHLPKRDLYVSPDHALLVGDLLINAGALVNGVSIIQTEPTETFTYFHVELEKHSLLIAEGAYAESYLPQREDRNCYDNAAEYTDLYPEGPSVMLWPLDYPRVSSYTTVPRYVRKRLQNIADAQYGSKTLICT